ncbi:MAG: Transcriptional regulator, AraC family protein [Myxococcaceae bacterium]|nr:Transcriptional regulator, AraC family protein [Myxococcaceae bacterium]
MKSVGESVPEHGPQRVGSAGKRAGRALGGLPRDVSLVEHAREYLSRRLDQGDFDLGSVATLLGTSERTLRRRLRELGTGYRELIDDVRRERALTLAHEGAHNVTAIATQVGFADVTTFTRAFRRWTGSLPSSYMAEARARTLVANSG